MRVTPHTNGVQWFVQSQRPPRPYRGFPTFPDTFRKVSDPSRRLPESPQDPRESTQLSGDSVQTIAARTAAGHVVGFDQVIDHRFDRTVDRTCVFESDKIQVDSNDS